MCVTCEFIQVKCCMYTGIILYVTYIVWIHMRLYLHCTGESCTITLVLCHTK